MSCGRIVAAGSMNCRKRAAKKKMALGFAAEVRKP